MGVNQTLEKWSANLSSIQAVLKDAEERQLEEEAVKLWLDELRDLAYDVQNILDKFGTEMLKRKTQGTKVLGSFSKAKFSFDMNTEINKITDRLQDISKRKTEFRFKEIRMSTKEWKRPPSTCQPDGPVIGRDEEKRQIVEFLSKEEASATNYHVVAIFGTGGVGKTTLAGHVFNDSDIRGKFYPKVSIHQGISKSSVSIHQGISKSSVSIHQGISIPHLSSISLGRQLSKASIHSRGGPASFTYET